MFSPDDTIVALATPPGRGGLAVVRLSGPRASDISAALIDGGSRLEPRRATLVRVVAGNEAGVADEGQAGIIDEAIATFFAAPASYTGEDVVEFSLHGSPVIAGELISQAMKSGARLAGPGEFTLRAFLNGRLDLTRAEAVRDLVEATTPLQARMAFDQLQGTLAERIGEIERGLFDLTARLEASADFPEEGYHFVSPEETLAAVRSARARMEALLADARRGRVLREGITVTIAGRANVGKSTLFNRLAGVERAIVTAVPGTTRDVLTEAIMLRGVRMTLVDTAGVRATTDPVEQEGVSRAEKASAAADVVLVVLDGSAPLTSDDARVLNATAGRTRLIAANKSDLPARWGARDLEQVLRGLREPGAGANEGVEPSGAGQRPQDGERGALARNEVAAASRRQVGLAEAGSHPGPQRRPGSTDQPEAWISRGPGSADQPEAGIARGPGSTDEPKAGIARGAGSADQPEAGIARAPGSTDQPEARIARRPGSAVQPEAGIARGPGSAGQPEAGIARSEAGPGDGVVAISAASGIGVEDLIRAINRSAGLGEQPAPAILSNIRQIDLLGHATEAVCRADLAVAVGLGQTPEELVLADLRLALTDLQEVTGERTTDDLLDAIFSQFCIGK